MAIKANESPLLLAVQNFCVKYSAPALVDEWHVVPAHQNLSLPKDKGDFIVVTPINQMRMGTTVSTFDPQTGTTKHRTYYEASVQVDVYSANTVDAADRAATLETMARSFEGVGFFKNYDIDCLYAENASNLTAALDSETYQSRWMLTLRLGFWKEVEVATDSLDSVDVRLKNVDVHFPPNEESR